MVQRISLTVRVPSIQKSHDFIVPNNMSVQKIINLMLLTLMDEYNGTANKGDKLMLIDMNDNSTLNWGCSLKQLGIKNGTKLMLI